MADKTSTARGASVAFLLNLIGKIALLSARLIASRLLGPAAYGVVALGMSTTEIIAFTGTAGLDQAALRFGAQYRGQRRPDLLAELLRLCLGAAALWSALLALLLFVFARPIATLFTDPRMATVFAIMAVGLVPLCIGRVTARAMQSVQRPGAMQLLLNLAPAVLMLTLVAPLWWAWTTPTGQAADGFQGVAWARVLGWTLTAALGVALVWPLLRARRPQPHAHPNPTPQPDHDQDLPLKAQDAAPQKPTPPQTDLDAAPKAPSNDQNDDAAQIASLKRVPRAQVARFALTMVFFYGIHPLVAQLDRLMLGALATSTDVGVYDISAMLANQLPIFQQALNAIAFAQIGALFHSGQRDALAALYKRTTRWAMLLTLPLALAVALLRVPLLSLFGEAFLIGATPLLILLLGQLGNVGVGPVAGILSMTGHERWVLINTIILAALNTLGNLLLIPELGILGAAISTACAVASWNLLALLQVRLIHGMHPYDMRLLRLFGFAAIAAVVGFGAELSLGATLGPWLGPALATALALITYAGLTLAFGLNPEDQQLITALRRKLGR